MTSLVEYNDDQPTNYRFMLKFDIINYFFGFESRHIAHRTKLEHVILGASWSCNEPACNSDQARAASGALIGLTCLTEASMADPGADAYAPFRRVRLPGKGSGLLAPALTNACRMPKPYKAVFGLSRARFGGDVANDSLAISPNRCGEEGKLQANIKRCKGLYSALVPCV